MCLPIVAGLTIFLLALMSETKGQVPRVIPLVPPDAADKIKHAYAALNQGDPSMARQLALEVYERYSDLLVAWYPAWLVRQVKKPLPDPYALAKELGKVSLGGVQVSLSHLRLSTSVVRLLFDASWELSRFDEITRWGEMLLQAGEKSPEVLRRIEYARVQLAQGWVYRIIAKPPRTNWRPLPLRFRLEDHFVVVPLEEASKLLRFRLQTRSDPKVVGKKVFLLARKEEPIGAWILLLAHPFAYRVEGNRQQPERLAYLLFEEKGKVWVPFYWLAEKAGIMEWELRGNKIYVSPR